MGWCVYLFHMPCIHAQLECPHSRPTHHVMIRSEEQLFRQNVEQPDYVSQAGIQRL